MILQHKCVANIHARKPQGANPPIQRAAQRLLLQQRGVVIELIRRVDEIARIQVDAERLALIRTRIRRSLDDPRPSLTLAEVDAHLDAAFARAKAEEERMSANATATG